MAVAVAVGGDGSVCGGDGSADVRNDPYFEAILAACRNGHVETAKVLFQSLGIVENDRLYQKCARYFGSRACILDDRGKYMGNEVGGWVETIRWAQKTFRCRFDVPLGVKFLCRVCSLSSVTGELMRWAFEQLRAAFNDDDESVGDEDGGSEGKSEDDEADEEANRKRLLVAYFSDGNIRKLCKYAPSDVIQETMTELLGLTEDDVEEEDLLANVFHPFLSYACNREQPDVAAWMVHHFRLEHYDMQESGAFLAACKSGRMSIICWMAEKFKDAVKEDLDEAIAAAIEEEQWNVVLFLTAGI